MSRITHRSEYSFDEVFPPGQVYASRRRALAKHLGLGIAAIDRAAESTMEEIGEARGIGHSTLAMSMLRFGAFGIALWPNQTPVADRLVISFPDGPSTAPAALYSLFWQVSEVLDDAIEAIGLRDGELSLHDLLTYKGSEFAQDAIDALSKNSAGKWSFSDILVERSGMFDGFDFGPYAEWLERTSFLQAVDFASPM